MPPGSPWRLDSAGSYELSSIGSIANSPGIPAACNCFCTYIISGSAFFNCCSKRAGERVYIAAFARINDESAQSCITKLAVRLVHGPPLAMVGVIGVSVVGGDSGRAITTAGFGGGFA